MNRKIFDRLLPNIGDVELRASSQAAFLVTSICVDAEEEEQDPVKESISALQNLHKSLISREEAESEDGSALRVRILFTSFLLCVM